MPRRYVEDVFLLLDLQRIVETIEEAAQRCAQGQLDDLRLDAKTQMDAKAL